MKTVETRQISAQLHAVFFDGSPAVSTLLARMNGEDDEYGNCDLFSMDNLDNAPEVRDTDYVIFQMSDSDPIFLGLLTQDAFINLFDESPHDTIEFD